MPPTPCPERVRKLINRVNRESGDEARVLRKILSAIRNKRQNNKGPETYVVNLPSTITVNLIDYSSSHIRNDLADALADIDPPSLIERIRECPVPHCNSLFWAGRDNKKACDKHVALWRQREYRKKKKKKQSAAEIERENAAATKTLSAMNRTRLSVIRAVMVSGARKFGAIDVASWWDFWNDGLLPRSMLVVRRVTHKLHKEEYLDYAESVERRDKRGFSIEDRYSPTQKLTDLWTASQRDLAERQS